MVSLLVLDNTLDIQCCHLLLDILFSIYKVFINIFVDLYFTSMAVKNRFNNYYYIIVN